MVGIAGGGLFGWILGNSSLNVSIVSETTNVHVSTSSTASVFFLAAMLVLVLLGSILWVKGKPPLDEEGVRKVIREEFERATATISFGLTGPQGPVDPSRNVTFRTAADHLGISDATSRSNRAQRGGSDSLETRDNATGPTDVDQ